MRLREMSEKNGIKYIFKESTEKRNDSLNIYIYI